MEKHKDLYDVLFIPHDTDLNHILLRGELTHENIQRVFEGDFGNIYDNIKLLTFPHEITAELSEVGVLLGDNGLTYWTVVFLHTYHLNPIEDAKQTLQHHGYYVDKLWHISDVYDRYPELNNEQAMDVLDRTLAEGNHIFYEIHEQIFEHGDDIINESANDYEE